MKNEKIYSMLFSKVYPLLTAKAERKTELHRKYMKLRNG